MKLDSLSLYSTESGSAASTLSPVLVHDETELEAVHPVLPITKANVLSHQVTLEDVTDDSDEECSPKKPKELFIREGAEDFFAIELVTTRKLYNECHSKNSSKDAQKSVFRLNNTVDGPNQSDERDDIRKTFDGQPEKSADHSLFRFSGVHADSKEPPLQKITPKADADNSEADNEFDDFVEFADFSSGQEPQHPFTLSSRITSFPSEIPVLEPPSQTIPQDAADDGFDDFQEFASSVSPPPPPPTQAIAATQNQIKDNTEADDDDFGDFSEPVVCPISVPPPPPPAAVLLSIDERVKPVLDSMFPRDNVTVQEITGLDHQRPLGQCQRFNFGAIEQARALDYQWSSSEMRHALVRSLGIDSRNIVS